MDNIIKLNEVITKALSFFDSPETETLNLDELEIVLREIFKLLNTQISNELCSIISEKDQYREYIIRQIEGWMRSLNYPENEILMLKNANNFNELMKIEERMRSEFDRRFHLKPIVPDRLGSKTQKINVFKIN